MATTDDMSEIGRIIRPARALDVSHLPTSAFDERAPLWWGNLLAIFIETATVSLLVASYFYCRLNFGAWPPPKVDVIPPIPNPVPHLPAGTINVILVVLSCIVVYVTDQAARRMRRAATLIGLFVMAAIALGSTVLRFYEFPAMLFWWNDNAYASLVWTTLGLHLTYLIGGAGEYLILSIWLATHEIDPKHALDVTLVGGYWYWVAGTHALIYAMIYWSPRLL